MAMELIGTFLRRNARTVAEDVRRIGVLWSGDHLFEGTVETLEILRNKGEHLLPNSGLALTIRPGKQVVFVTNNSTKSRAEYIKKLTSMGIPAKVVRPPLSPLSLQLKTNVQDDVFGSSYSAAVYISRILPLPASQKTVFVLGEKGIETELDSENVPHIGGTDPSLQRAIEQKDYEAIASGASLDPSVGVVLCGLDFHINYLKIALAYHYLQRGAVFLATNMDATLPSANTLFPGAGTCAAPLVSMMGGKKPTSLGKPSQAMMDAIEGKFRFERKRACMVGDRLDTDIRFGIEGGLGGTLCVLTGVTRSAEEWKDGETVPSFYVDKLGDLKAGT